jgi:hypothetical protein
MIPAYALETVSAYEHTLLWVNPATPDLDKEQKFDHYPDSSDYVVLLERR